MKKTAIFTLLLSLFLISCSTKREYFHVEDEQISGKINAKSELGSKIKYVSSTSATLKNGEILNKNIINSVINLQKGERLINVSENKFIVCDIDGNLRVLNENGGEIYKENVKEFVVSASINNDDLAILTTANKIYLIKMSQKMPVLREISSSGLGSYTNVANPVFAGPIIIYPTLDGKIYIVDRASNRVVQSMAVSNENSFDTIIFLESTAQNLYVASASRLYMISPMGNKSVSADIKNVVVGDNRIFVLQSDGVVKAYDLNLNEIAQNKFKFAIFEGAIIKNGSLNILEKTGFLIKTDLNLANPKYYEIGGEISDRVFVGKDSFYYANKVLRID